MKMTRVAGVGVGVGWYCNQIVIEQFYKAYSNTIGMFSSSPSSYLSANNEVIGTISGRGNPPP